MSDKELEAKIAYFKEQELLDISDDEIDWPDKAFLDTERAVADSKALPTPKLGRQRSNFLRSTPRKKQAEFEVHTAIQRAAMRKEGRSLIHSTTNPQAVVGRSSPSTDRGHKSPPSGSKDKLKRVASLPSTASSFLGKDEIPFYKRAGIVPRELKSGKNVKPANNIRLEPMQKQLLRSKVIYFYPNDDVSMARRRRIHKFIQLGAAWVTNWRDDITHVMVDEASYTYTQVLKHLNRAGLPRKVTLVKFDPYVPQCIQFNTLLEPTAERFLVKGAPRPSSSFIASTLPERVSPSASQVSLQSNQSSRQLIAQDSQKFCFTSTAGSVPVPIPESDPPSSSYLDIVKDSFIATSSDSVIPSDPIGESFKAAEPYDDALSQAITETKAVSHLPLDDEDESPSSSSHSTAATDQESDLSTDEEEATNPVSKRTHKSRSKPTTTMSRKPRKGVNQLTFQCMNPASSHTSSQNPNARTIQILEDMCKYYDQMQDQWRTLAYRRGISTLKKQTTKISTKEEAEALPFIGSNLAGKIEEIVLTDRLRRLDSTRNDSTDQVLRLFLGIYGVGLRQANKWIQNGYRTLDDLVDKAKLTESQKIGIEHYDDFAERISRAEVKAHGDYVRTALHKIDPGFKVHIMGSYRRGAKDSGDIDLIITKPATSLSILRTIIFSTLIPTLFSHSFLKASLATSQRANNGSKWLGASCLPSSKIWRRLDLLLVPEEEIGAALLYFTGNDIFNRSMRLLASKKGMRLNQKGLYKDVLRGKGRQKITDGTLVEGKSERKIFELLGVPWREPTERIC